MIHVEGVLMHERCVLCSHEVLAHRSLERWIPGDCWCCFQLRHSAVPVVMREVPTEVARIVAAEHTGFERRNLSETRRGVCE